MRTAILGAGSLGTIIGAFISSNGKQVDLIDSFKGHVDALNANGATVTGYIDLNVPVKARTPDEMAGIYDLVILLTKQTTNKTALTRLLPHLGPDSVVCTLQNGIPEENVAAIVGKERTVGGAVGFGATWVRPGVSMLTSPMETVRKYAFEIGEMDGVLRPRLSKIKEILDSVGETKILTNLMGIRWTKVLINATFSGMSAALGCTFGDVLESPKAMRCVAHIADETIKTCHAQGYEMVNMQGANLESLELNSEADIPEKMPLYRKVWGPHYKLKASMLQDLEKKIPCEIDYINGIICVKGREFGVPTPFNDKVVELVKSAEAQGIITNFGDLDRFDDVLAKCN